MPPPPRNGGIDSRSSARAQSTPIPVGPSILCALKQATSTSRAATSIGAWPTSWAASIAMSAPAACAASARRCSGGIVPSTLDIPVTERSLAPASCSSRSCRSSRKASLTDEVAQLDAALGLELQPRDEVRVVLHLGEHDDVALGEERRPPGSREEVERLGRVLREDHLVVGIGARR